MVLKLRPEASGAIHMVRDLLVLSIFYRPGRFNPELQRFLSISQRQCVGVISLHRFSRRTFKTFISHLPRRDHSTALLGNAFRTAREKSCFRPISQLMQSLLEHDALRTTKARLGYRRTRGNETSECLGYLRVVMSGRPSSATQPKVEHRSGDDATLLMTIDSDETMPPRSYCPSGT